jgi:MscS family membrane protein
MRLLLDIDWGFFNQEYFGEKVSDYMWFAGIVVGTLLLKKPIAGLLTRVSSSIAIKFSYMQHKSTIREMLFKPMELLLQTILYFIATEQIANVLDRVSFHRALFTKKQVVISLGDITDHVFLFLFIVFLTRVITRFVDFIYYIRMGKAQQEMNYARMQLYPLMKEMSKLLLWVISAFWILGSVFHVNIPALITGLGIGGVAIALAGKETVENFFAAFTILSDKPFQTGETIKLGDIEGVVERIGFRSTRLRNADGSAYIIPNQNLVSQSVINLSMRDIRGMKVIANVKYGISHEALMQLMATLKEELLKMPMVKAPVEASIEAFDKETFQLLISYNLPHPLPDQATLIAIKRDINLKVFEIISTVATLGTPIGTSGSYYVICLKTAIIDFNYLVIILSTNTCCNFVP